MGDSRTTFFRQLPAPRLTEPLSSQDWSDFASSIGQNSQQTHEICNKSFDLELLRSVVKQKWKAEGKSGSPKPPTPILSAVSADPDIELMPMEIGEATETISETLKQGRKRKEVDYRVSAIGLDFDYDDEDDNTPKRRATKSYYLPVSDSQTPNRTPKPPYTGKKRGRPRKVPLVETSRAEYSSPRVEKHRFKGSPLLEEEEHVKGPHTIRQEHAVETARKMAAREHSSEFPYSSPQIFRSHWSGTEPVGTVLKGHSAVAPPLETPPPTRSLPNNLTEIPKEKDLPAKAFYIPDLPLTIRQKIPSGSQFFDRPKHVTAVLGGNGRTMCVRPSKDYGFDTKAYVAANTAWNPHLPKAAGEHGCIIHVFRTVLDQVTSVQEIFPLFVGRGISNWEYCGQYTVCKIQALTDFETRDAHNKLGGVKDYWAKEIFRAKHRSQWRDLFMYYCGWDEREWQAADEAKIKAAFQDGRVKMVWVHLQCVDYEPKIYEALVRVKREKRALEQSASKQERLAGMGPEQTLSRIVNAEDMMT